MNSEMEGNPICAYCGKDSATAACCCTYPTFPICEGCKHLHFPKPGAHYFLPFSLTRYIHSLKDCRQVVKRRRDLDAAEFALMGNFSQIDNLEKQLNDSCDSAMRKLMDLKEDCRGKIEELRRNVSDMTERAKYEANEHMMEGSYEASTQLARAILQFREDDEPSTLVMVEGRVDYKPEVLDSAFSVTVSLNEPETSPVNLPFEPIVQHLSVSSPILNIQMSNFSEPEAPAITSIDPIRVPEAVSILPTPSLLPLVTSRYLAVLDCATGTWKPKINFPRTMSIDEKSAAVLLPDNSVVVAGGGLGKNRWSAEVYRIPESGEITQLKSLNDARRFPGICLCAGEIFLFGGINTREMAQSEKLVVAELQAWTRLPNMLTPRSNFNPCTHLDLVYLCGGAETTACEAYYRATSTFQSLNLVLPECGPTSTVIVGTEMVILAWHYVMWWDGQQSTREARHTDWNVWSNSPPQVVEKSAFLVRSWNECAFRIDLDGLHYTKLP